MAKVYVQRGGLVFEEVLNPHCGQGLCIERWWIEKCLRKCSVHSVAMHVKL